MHNRVTEWWSGISLRSKVTGVTVMLLTLGLLVAGVGTMSFLRGYLLGNVNETLMANSADPSAALALACDDVKLDKSDFYAVIKSNGGIMCENNPADSKVPEISAKTLPSVITRGHTFTLEDKARTTQWTVTGIPLNRSVLGDQPVAILVGQNLYLTNDTVGRFALIFLFFALTVVVLGGALTRLLVTSTFTPLREVEDTAARFAAGDFSQRLERVPHNTEVGRLNESLNAMLSRIDASFADRMRTLQQMRRFVGDASHELRTPLVSVRGYAELYRMGALGSPEEVAQAMGRIEKEAIRMGELVEDLLELARIDEAKPLNLVAVDLVPLAHDAALDAMASAPDRRVTVVVTEPIRAAVVPVDPAPQVTPSTPHPVSTATRPFAFAGATLALLRNRNRRPRPVAELAVETVIEDARGDADAIVRAEENKIRQVITNLMGNALRFTPDNTPIEIGITVDQPGDSAYISVIDHGHGIPPQIREKIFQRFWRADASRNRDTGGSGLGLAIVAGIVASHQGSVDVVETPGGGATFRVRLPLLHRTAEAGPANPSTPKVGG
ncbi:MAG: two-component system, OmpR family, sensor kinase [Actinomycetota bacterium]|jgi:two-component system, OmpR family, sensor kinase|nr:two-component system, OmpR family, sensor kinase [Actinomycetota bacterium]MDQ1573472.1 two-component system, OmpR family, sensor kinase [Actinomycetota bacterium]